jgi:hypothetical protein
MRDCVVERHDSPCEKFGNGLGSVITGMGSFIRLSQEIADNDRQMVSNMLYGHIA